MDVQLMDEITVKIDERGRIWHNGMKYISEAEIYGNHQTEHPENEEYQTTEEEIHNLEGD